MTQTLHFGMDQVRYNGTSLPGCGHGLELYSRTQMVVRVYLLIPVIIFGTCAGGVNIRIFLSASMRSSLINWYLLSLSISDCLLLNCSFCMFSFPAVAELAGSVSVLQVATYTMRWFYPIGTMIQALNIYLTVLVSFHRYLGVCHPFRAQRWLTTNQLILSVVGAVVFSILFNMTRIYEITLVSCMSETRNTSSVMMQPTELLQDKLYFLFYSVIAYSCFMFIFPFTSLIVVNTCIMHTLYHSSKKRKRMASVRKRQAQQQERKEFSTTVMLLAVVALFLLCNSLPFVNNIIDIIIHYGGAVSIPNHFLINFTVLVEVGNLMVAVNSATSLIVYTTFGSKYRKTMMTVFASWKQFKESSLNDDPPQSMLLVSSAYQRRSCGGQNPRASEPYADHSPRPSYSTTPRLSMNENSTTAL